MWDKRNDMVVHGADPYNAEPARHALAQDHITSADTFYSRNHGPVPRIDPDDWRLRVTAWWAPFWSCPATTCGPASSPAR
jgi:sulfite oxidase